MLSKRDVGDVLGAARMLPLLRAVIGALCILLMLGESTPARSQQQIRRVALVVGNSTYTKGGASSVPWSHDNAEEVATTLKRLNFEVVRKFDLDWDQFDSALSDFEQQASTASVALFYYSGHAMHVGDRSYLIPTDALLDSKRSIDFKTMSLDYDVAQKGMGDAQRKIIIVDAPPDNSVADQYAMKFDPEHDIRNVRGLAKLPLSEGLLVASASSSGFSQKSGRGDTSLYTATLVKAIGAPGREVRALLEDVDKSVLKATNNRQRPEFSAPAAWSDFYFAPPKSDEQVWSELKGSQSPEKLSDFLRRFPSSKYAAAAKEQLKAIAAANRRRREEQAAKAEAAREQAAKEKAAKEEAAREQAAREQAAKEKAARAEAAREQAAREKAAKDEAAREQAAKEKAAKEAAAREQAAREQAAKEKAAREEAAREQAAKEKAAKDEAAREQAAREQAAKEEAAKEEAARQQAAKEKAAKEEAAREEAARGRAAKEQATKENATKEGAAREQAAKERAAKEQAARAQAAKEQARRQAVRDAETRQAKKKEAATRERAAQARQAAARAREAQSRSGSRIRIERQAPRQAAAPAPVAQPRAVETQGCNGCGF